MKIADMHCDTLLHLYGQGKKTGLRENGCHVDISKMQRADYLIQNFAVFIDAGASGNPFEDAMAVIDRYYQELAANADRIAPVFSWKDIQENQRNGKLCAMLTLEEGAVIKGRLEYLRNFHRLGVRMMTLTWNYENELGVPNLIWKSKGVPALSARNPKGLTPMGIQAVEEMERVGIIPDVSHLSDGGFWDVAKHTRKPFVASHSNAAAVCNVSRNLPDDMIRCLGERGGVMGLNLAAGFLTDPESADPETLLAAAAGHVAHAADVGGVEVCALGSDLDGIGTNPAVPDASFMPRIADALKKKGFHESEIEKVFSKNVLRVYRETLGDVAVHGPKGRE